MIFTVDASLASYSGTDDFWTYASASLYGISEDGVQMPGITRIGASNGMDVPSLALEVLYSSGAAAGGGFLSLGASLSGTVSPVPEPSRAAILLLGVPVVFTAMRRRRSATLP